MKLLIVEDEPELAADLQAYLSDKETVCETAPTLDEALEKINLYDYDCILLDVTLPDGNGLSVLRELKKRRKTDGVIIISARHSLEDKIEGLQLGADDYLSKPFHLSELAVRIMAVTRRNQFAKQNVFEAGGLRLDLQLKTVTYLDAPVSLTPTEYRLLRRLIASQNKVLSKTSLAEYLAGDQTDWMDNYDFVYAHMKNLKRKLAEAGCPDYIKTVYAVGYKFQTEP